MTSTSVSKPNSTTFPAYLLDRYKQWYRERYEGNKAWHANLAANGQRPRTMVISCCDSRMDSVAMFGSEPGDLFVVRNVANLVPPYSPDSKLHGTSAAIEYAVLVLKVTHIIVVGHSGCGGVGAYYDMCCNAHNKDKDKDKKQEQGFMFIGQWMDILKPAYTALTSLPDLPKQREERMEVFEKQAVKNSLLNLQNFPFVKKALEEEKLTLHGGWFDISTGMLHELAGDTFQPVS